MSSRKKFFKLFSFLIIIPLVLLVSFFVAEAITLEVTSLPSVETISVETIIEVKNFKESNLGGEGILKKAKLGIENQSLRKTFEVLISEEAEYYLTAWLNTTKGQESLNVYLDEQSIPSGVLQIFQKECQCSIYGEQWGQSDSKTDFAVKRFTFFFFFLPRALGPWD